MYAEPSGRFSTPASIRIGRSSSRRRPSNLRPRSSTSWISFGMCSMSSMSSRPPRICFLEERVHGLRQPDRLRVVLDELDHPGRDHDVLRVPVDPDPSVLADEPLDLREALDELDHRAVLTDDARDLRVAHLDDLAALDLVEFAVLHRTLHALRLVDLKDTADCAVPEVHAPRGLRRVQGGGVRGVDVEEPVARPQVDDLADDLVVRAGHVPAAEGNHGHEAVALCDNPELGRVDVPAVGVRPFPGLRAPGIDQLSGYDHTTSCGRIRHRIISLTPVSADEGDHPT